MKMDQKMATVMMILENVLASMALMETTVTHVARIFLDFHTVEVFFLIFQKIMFQTDTQKQFTT